MAFYVFSFSSKVYPLSIVDVNALPRVHVADSVFHGMTEPVILLGGNQFVDKDCLVCGQKQIQQALHKKQSVIWVRFAFTVPVTVVAIFALLKKVRYHLRTRSSGVYHIDPQFLRSSGLERMQRNASNAYQFSAARNRLNKSQQLERYRKLQADMKKGYNDSFPVRVMLCRKNAIHDSLDDGHHRLGIALDSHMPRIAISFCYASSWAAVRQILMFWRCRQLWHKRKFL